jgi:Fic-DOC domain mobile mystery protein B
MVNINGIDPIGATPIEDYSGLKLSHINTRKELYEAEFTSITMSAAKYLLRPPSLPELMDRHYLLKIHKSMLSNVWSWAGKKRTSNKSVGVDKFQIDIELTKFSQDFQYWEGFGMDPIEVSARIHQRLVYIHPFENGNGRWARFITNLYLQKKLKRILHWPEDELYITTAFRSQYIEALRMADQGNLTMLIDIHRKLLK